MQKHKTIEDYFIKNNIQAMHEKTFKLFYLHKYRIDINIKCIDTYMDTLYFLLDNGVSFIKETKYFEFADEKGQRQREYCYEYSYGASTIDNWITSVYYSLIK